MFSTSFVHLNCKTFESKINRGSIVGIHYFSHLSLIMISFYMELYTSCKFMLASFINYKFLVEAFHNGVLVGFFLICF